MRKLIRLYLLMALFAPLISAQDRVQAVGGSVQVFYTSSDGAYRLSPQPAKTLASVDGTSMTTIAVNSEINYQRILGLGGSLESSSVYNLTHMSAANRDAVMEALFSPVSGNTFNLVRLSFGCSDFCAEPFYTYDDNAGVPDPDLLNFSIQKDIDAGIISVARQALRINPDVKFFASVWSAPAWMKDNNSLNNGGHLRPEYYSVLATYYRKAIQAYQQQGIPIYAVTTQNEPTVAPNYPSMLFSPAEQRDFVIALAKELEAHGLGSVKIWVQDDNLWATSSYAAALLADPAVAPYIDGAAFHDYEGDPGYTGDLNQVSALALQHPGTTMHLTERSYRDMLGADRMVQLFRNWMSSWNYWLTFLDDQGQPNYGPLNGACCDQPVEAQHGNLDNWWLSRDYYTYGQFSRFIKRDAMRIASDYGSASTVTNVAFKNPDGSIVVVVVNQTTAAQPFKIVSPDGQFTDTLPARTMATYQWTASTGTALTRTGWSAAAFSASGAETPGNTLDTNINTRWASGQAQAPGQTFTVNLGAPQTFDQVSLDMGCLASLTLPRSGWIASASSSYGSDVPANALDGNGTTRWSTGQAQASGQWFQVDMGAPHSFNQITLDAGSSTGDYPRHYQVLVSHDGIDWGSAIANGSGSQVTTLAFAKQTARYIRIVQTGSTGANWWSIHDLNVFEQCRSADDYPRDYKLLVSNDGVNWGNPIATGSGTPRFTNIAFAPVTAQYLRIEQTSSASNWWTMAELLVYHTAAPSPLPRTGWTASASSSNGSAVPANALDGHATTRWSSGQGQTNGQWFQVDFGSHKIVRQVSLDAGSSSGDYPRGYAVYVSSDGTSWGSPVASGSGSSQLTIIPFPAQSARYIRIVQTGSACCNWWSIHELTAYQ